MLSNRKLVKILAVVMVSLVGIAACTGEDEATESSSSTDQTSASETTVPGASELFVGAVSGSAANPAVTVMNDAMKAYAQSQGVRLVVETSEGVEEQIAKAETLIAQGVQYLGLHPWDGEAVIPLIESANEQGVKVIILIDGVPGVVDDGTALTFISGDEIETGRQIGEWVVENHPQAEAAVLTGTPGNLAAENRTNGFMQGVEGSEVEIVANSTANWARDEALRVAGDMLTANPGLSVFFANNDEMAFGALAAVEEAGRRDDTAIIGYNGTCVGLEALLNGEFDLEAVLPFDLFGQGLIDVALADSAGEDVPAQIEPEIPLLTQDDARAMLDGSLDTSPALLQRLQEADEEGC